MMPNKNLTKILWLSDMDQNIKRMLKLIEDDGDTFAKKAEMYYQKRPELIHLVEEFSRMYRSLAERYDSVTGEIRKNAPSELQSWSSGISEVISEPSSICPSPEYRTSRRRSGPRAAGFDFFLGNIGGGSELGDELSCLDSESESDESLYPGGVHGNDDDQGWRRKVNELEIELRNVKAIEGKQVKKLEKKIYKLEEEVKSTKEKLNDSEKEISKLLDRLSDRDQEITQLKEAISDADKSLSDQNVGLLEEITKLQNGKSYIRNDLKELNQRCQMLEDKLKREKAEKLEMEDEIEQLEATVSEKNDQISELNKNLDVFRLTHEILLTQKDGLDAKVDELIVQASGKDDRIDEVNVLLNELHKEHMKLISEIEGTRKYSEELRLRVMELEKELKRQETVIEDGAEEKREAIRQLCFSLEHYRKGYHRLRQVVIAQKRTTN